ncbi:penicillin acylase family protein [Maribacter polysaccharolyticus]|uniref:penicillin acylase family protein n=1 Tax=Maribacter polysaccharolyticus TaxID=3020831 RepID=UPI00237FD33A|nr:penicillin acylase family protein [Maribacter polysaccharolyticus]MDE3740245.1 penicillin acylase family protein [Maribacter polysaccharolyticus]
MKHLKTIGWAVLVLLAVSALFAGVTINNLAPTYEGQKTLPKLAQETQVYYDPYGIPHIYADNIEDAFRTLGYVHAQDRLWQMELLRRIGTGRLSEVFGRKMLDTDKFFLSLGIDEATEQTVSELDMNNPMVRLSQAYLDGLNQFIAEGPTPLEFYLTGIEKAPFELGDVYNIVGYMAFSFAMAHKTDPLLTNIKEKLGTAYLVDLDLKVDPHTVWIKNHREVPEDTLMNSIAAATSKALKSLSLPLFEGSNSWVIAPEKTRNGKVIFANDPHIGFSQPAVWYEAHISTPDYEKYGFFMGGIPFPLLAHDRHSAYGLTMFENDDIDFFYEETHSTDKEKYKTKYGWSTYEKVEKTIKIKDSSDYRFTYRKSVHGPIMNGVADQVKGERPIAMWWMYTQHKNEVMDVFYKMSQAKNKAEFQRALPKMHAPGLNIMYGDAEGNVAWWATAKLYKDANSDNTKFVLGDSSDLNVPERYLDFSQNPQAINPPWKYVYSANNQPDSIAGMQYPGYYLPENRALRITDLLEAKNDWTLEDVKGMINDVVSPVHPMIVDNLGKYILKSDLSGDQLAVLDRLLAWKGESHLKSMEPTVFHRWVYFFLKNTFADELGEEMFGQFLSTHLLKRSIAPMAAIKESVWWDDSTTLSVVETKTDIVTTSFIEACNALKNELGPDWKGWTWEKVHTLEHSHPIGQVEALRSFFNVGPFPVVGTREVINNMAFDYDGDGMNNVTAGPSTRRVIDFSDIENSMGIIPTGQSGNPFSEHYDDQAEMYVRGEFRKMMLNETEIMETSKSLLTFKLTE